MVTVGELLKNERLKKNLTLKQVEKSLRVREKFLLALEENNWETFSSKIYITGLITNYSRLLGLNTQKMLIFFRRDYEKKDDLKFKKRTSSQYLASPTKRIATSGVVLIVLVFLLYFSYQLTQFLAPPKVIWLSPQKTTFRSGEKITIKGKTDKDAAITIFGDRIYQTKEGIFTYDFPLKKGTNELTIEVVGANGKKTNLKKEFTGT